MLLLRGRALARLRAAAGRRTTPVPLLVRPPLSAALLSRGSGSGSGSGVRAAATTANDKPQAPSAAAAAAAAPKRPAFCRHCGASPMQFRVPEGDTHPRELCAQCGAIEYRNPRLVVGAIVARGASGGGGGANSGGGGGGGGGRGWAEVLLCRRAIEPQYGRWTLPAGYLEVGESSAQGAAREVLEETGAEVVVARPYAHFDVPVIGQIYQIFLARLKEGGSGVAASTAESLETRWFSVDGGDGGGGGGGGGDGGEEGQASVPWGELAFSSVETALRLYAEDVRAARRSQEEGGGGGGGGGGEEEDDERGKEEEEAFPGRFFRQHHGVVVRQPGAGPNDPGTYALRDHSWSGGGGGGRR